ncbi:BLUF domain-containing protein [Thiocystis violacea]|uniref:BLUF domain-containing protein n=1 Tax=Thiocystis violacea TaxID=13725 RepID=UPI001906B6C8|nr:BLUF domain-containing protein [Thiocystis violacea]
MEAFTKIHVHTIREYQLRQYGATLDFRRAVGMAGELWQYIRHLYAGEGPFMFGADERNRARTPSSMALVHLIYVSTASKALSREELERILDSSIRHNALRNVTGMLLYANGTFMQALEGEEAAVDETYARILQDPRHTAIVMLHDGPLAARRFDDWSMGFRQLAAEDAQAHPEYAPFFHGGFDAPLIRARPGLALAMLVNLGSSTHRQAAGLR